MVLSACNLVSTAGAAVVLLSIARWRVIGPPDRPVVLIRWWRVSRGLNPAFSRQTF